MNVMKLNAAGDHDSLGHRIRRARLEKYLSLEQLAENLGVSKVTIWNWENNRTRPRYPRLEELGAALGLPLDILVGGSEAANQNLPGLIYDCQCRIAESAGVQPDSVEIKITFTGQSPSSQSG